jgi:hypothetical protein
VFEKTLIRYREYSLYKYFLRRFVMKNRLIGRGMFLIVLVFFGLVFTGCPADVKTDDEPVIPNNPPTDTVDPAFWFGEIYFSLIERVGEMSSDNYSGGTGDEMGQIANCQYVIDAINAKWGKNYTPAPETALLAANCEYLLKAIDRANDYTTAFGTSARATQQLVDTDAVNQAVNTLWVPGGKFVAAAYGSKVAYSIDGINWTEATLPSSANRRSVTYGNGKFVAVTYNNNKAAYSTDGINWTATTMPIFTLLGFNNWQSVIYGGD